MWLVPYTGHFGLAVVVCAALVTTMGPLALSHVAPLVRDGTLALVAPDVLLILRMSRMNGAGARHIPASATIRLFDHGGQVALYRELTARPYQFL